MRPRYVQRNRIDRQGLTWVMVWSIALSFVAASILRQTQLNNLSEQSQITLGFVLGGLTATWALMLTWVAIADLPLHTKKQYYPEWVPGRLEARVQLLAVWLIPAFIFSYVTSDDRLILAQVYLTTFTAVAGPTVVMQWTRQRIHRVVSSGDETRSIRQMLGLATTIAILIAAIQWSRREFSIPSAVIAAMVVNAVLWIVMLGTILGRWRALYLLAIPVYAGLWIAASLFVEYQDRNNELQPMRLDGMMLGFFFFSTLLLFLMRSSGHRWSPLRRHRVVENNTSGKNASAIE